ncbi:hypothetical protein PYCCODRAFT_1437089 [Trametes coccinea BRFM310]|uniref:Uncharacterized protein n=1 Tax=Trametes coccinea (strain BRFM310) TaxID=1353009 RepID=A0A1Y2II16_TRAC3|nr:hypothetical protein PYCCODRAFT_1437089 [Trametes coccinea BRFM310]
MLCIPAAGSTRDESCMATNDKCDEAAVFESFQIANGRVNKGRPQSPLKLSHRSQIGIVVLLQAVARVC